jgi:hypothetical protein
MSPGHLLHEEFSLAPHGRDTDHPRMDPRYPIGRFAHDPVDSPEKRKERIALVAGLPDRLEETLRSLAPGAVDRRYRDGGWTVRQVVHHLADSHLNAYVRFRLALTEENPAIKTYEESRWAELHDARTAEPGVSLSLLRAVHARMVALLESLTEEQFSRPAQHPEWGQISVDWILQMYAWHGRHHLAQIDLVKRDHPKA